MKLLQLDLQFLPVKKQKKQRLKKAGYEKKGQTAKSQDVNTAISLLSVFGFLMFFSSNIGQVVIDIFHKTFGQYMLMDLTAENLHQIGLDLILGLLCCWAPSCWWRWWRALAQTCCKWVFFYCGTNETEA